MRGCLGEGEWDELEVWDRHICMCVHAKSLQSCLTVCYPMDCSLLGFSVHGILLARIPEWVAIPFSRGSSWPRDQSWVSHFRQIIYCLHHQGSPVIYTLLCIKYITNENLLYNTVEPHSVLCGDLNGKEIKEKKKKKQRGYM